MNRIFLDKLIEFTHSTYKNNYSQYNKLINLDDEITKIKQSQSLNEKGTLIKYNYIELSNIFNNFEQNELVLIYPICFNLEDKIEWFNLLNCLLIILNDDYINESNIIKKKILLLADKMYNNKIKTIPTKLDNNIYSKIANITNINLAIIKSHKDILLFENNSTNKWIICVNWKNDYYPLYNFENKSYTSDHIFIKYIININKNFILEKEKVPEQNNLDKKNSTQLVNIEIDNENKEKNNDAYEEFMTVEDYTLYISEAGEKKSSKKNKNVNIVNQISSSENKKKVKSNKNIFVVNDETKIMSDELDENIKPTKKIKTKKMEKLEEKFEETELANDSIFKKTDIVDMSKISNIISLIKPTSKLEIIQGYAIELGIGITNGSTKDGKPKSKTKTDLINDIKNMEQSIQIPK
jgi:hypothetical protein